MTDTRIPLAGVIGSPISHSKSPALHGYWLKRYGLKGHYIPMDVSQADLRDALRLLPRLGFVGLNVTIPHQETVLALADIITDRAALIGAANTLIFRPDGKIHADKGLKCADCHQSGLFKMKKGADVISMKEMEAGKNCGGCHNGTKAFSVKDAANCGKCHKK